MRHLANIFILLVLLGTMLLPLASTISGIDYGSALNENRRLAKFPGWPSTWESLAAFPEGYDAYLKDNFGLRRLLLRGFTLAKLKVFQESSHEDVLLGKNGWLFLNGKQVPRAYYLGKVSLGESKRAAWRNWIAGKNAWLAERGIDHVFAVAPNKEWLYPEFAGLGPSLSGPGTLLDQLASDFRAHGQSGLLDLRPVLLHMKPEHQLYYCLDTHWNNYGAYFGYAEIMSYLAQKKPAYTPHPLSTFRSTKDGKRSFDLADMMGAGDLLHEAPVGLEAFVLPKLSRRDLAIPKDSPLYQGLLDGWQPYVVSNEKGTGRVMLIADSYGEALWPYLEYQFAETVVVRGSADSQMLAAWCNEFKPDVVVEVIVERNLMVTPGADKEFEAALLNAQ
jgi:alginate O-acetyltransferase complex protein AlgJ